MKNRNITRGPLCGPCYRLVGGWDPQQFEFVTPPTCLCGERPAIYIATFERRSDDIRRWSDMSQADRQAAYDGGKAVGL